MAGCGSGVIVQARPLRSWAGTFGANIGMLLMGMLSGIAAARLLGVEDRGHLAEIIVVSALAASLGGLSLGEAMTMEVARLPSADRCSRPADCFAQAHVTAAAFAALASVLAADSWSRLVAFVCIRVLAGLPALALGSAARAAEFLVSPRWMFSPAAIRAS